MQLDNVYKRIGVNPVINATANKTHLGGSAPSAQVMRAMAEANEYYVHMDELMAKSGESIAERRPLKHRPHIKPNTGLPSGVPRSVHLSPVHRRLCFVHLLNRVVYRLGIRRV